MSRFHDHISDEHRRFIEEQKVFFVATAAPGGRVNVSPKGMDTFRVLGRNDAAYADLTGSGNETAAHIKHDGRITVMFVSFGARPLILRLYGRGTVVTPAHADWRQLSAVVPELPGRRQVIRIQVASVQASCGMSIPIFSFERQRPDLVAWAENMGPARLASYWRRTNAASIDGLATDLAPAALLARGGAP